VSLNGLSGRRYPFLLADMERPFNRVPGLYAFGSWQGPLSLLAGVTFAPAYIGQASDLEARLRCHEVWPIAQRSGASVALALRWDGSEASRLEAERDLIGRYNPRLNTQGRTGPSGTAPPRRPLSPGTSLLLGDIGAPRRRG
jgi:hypothetical protein